VLENDRVRMWDYTWTPGDSPGERQYAFDSVEVIVTGGSIRTRTADGEEKVRVVSPKDARFIRRGHRESQVAASGAPRAITIELK
jgi:hypothetical protein